MRFLSVCSGIEAASVAWNPLGWKAWAFSEIEPFPSAVLAHHYPTTPNLGDMTRFKDWPDATVDLLCGGTPCQSFSNAGLRAGLDDPRGQLMLTFGAIAARYRPRWLVWENVPGVLSSGGGRDFGAFLGLLGFLGYGFAYRVLDAQFVRVDGYARAVPQRRQRVFVVGCLGDWRSAAAVLLERESLRGDPAPRREARKDAAAGAGDGTSFCVRPASKGAAWKGDGADNFVAHALTGEGFDASEDGTVRGTPLVSMWESETLIPTNGGVFDVADVAPTIDASYGRLQGASGQDANHGHSHLIAFDTTQITSRENRANPQPGGPCHPLSAHAHAPAIAFDARQSDVIQYGEKTGPLDTDGSTIGLQIGAAVRRLIPVECERLQGMPDHYTAITYRGKPAADGPRYKALGNSWAIPPVRWIGMRIAMVDALQMKQLEAA